MKAVMYGAGNIGRGFIAKRFFLSGMTTTFIDVNPALVAALNAAGKYPVYVTRRGGFEADWVGGVSAVDGRDAETVAREIAGADIMATALGVGALPRVAELLAGGILLRRATSGRPLNILICENLIGAEERLRSLVAPFIPEEARGYFQDMIGFVGVSVCVTVPPTPKQFLEDNSLALCTDDYRELPVDLAAFRPAGVSPPEIDGMVASSPFSFFIERKLLIHNMGHALTAYCGALKGLETIYDIVRDGEIKYILTRALLEAARGLAARHSMPLDGLLSFVEELMVRFENPLLTDDVLRVGRDPARKLSAGDRLGGAFRLVRETGGIPAHVAVGIAAGLRFEHPGDPVSLEVAGYTREAGVEAALGRYCSIVDPAEASMISEIYSLLGEGWEFKRLVPALSEIKGRH